MRLVILLSVTTKFVIPLKTGIHCDTYYFGFSGFLPSQE